MALSLGSPELSMDSLGVSLWYSGLGTLSRSLQLVEIPLMTSDAQLTIPEGKDSRHLVKEASTLCQPSIPFLSFGCQLGQGAPPPSLKTEGD